MPKCARCGKQMTQSEVKESLSFLSSPEPSGTLMCDKCFNTTTLEIAKGAFPMVFADDNLEPEQVS